MASYDDFCLWNKSRLQQFLRERNLPTTGKNDELRALAYGANYFDIPVKPSAKEENKQRAEQYRQLLTVNGNTLPDPFSDLKTGWKNELNGISLWPPCMYGDISEYLVEKSERDLRTRLLTDYKEGKAFSYFDSKWLKEVFYHGISSDAVYCFLKADCTQSMNVSHDPHKVWVCIHKKSGKIISGYCTCFAGLGSTCNHVAAVLFKLDYAWQKGLTNKACTSLPATWTAPSKTKLQIKPKRMKDMEWRKPHYTKKGPRTVINPVARRLFSPVDRHVSVPSLESLMGALYVSCSNASVFQYAAPNATAAYSTDDDINVEVEVEVETTPGIFPSMTELGTIYGNELNEKLPAMTSSQVAAVEEATRAQSDNPTWKDQRVGRITGSNAHHVLTVARKLKQGNIVNSDNLISNIMGRKTIDPNIPALKYGRKMEPVARDAYERTMKKRGHKTVVASECGLFIHSDYIYIGASPDARVSCDCCGTGLLEIKCPVGIAHSDPQVSPPSYLIQNKEKTLYLKESHPYHTQILMQLAVTNYEWCDFFVYTTHGFHLERLYKTSYTDKIREILKSAETIFTRYILPELVCSDETSAMATNQTATTSIAPGLPAPPAHRECPTAVAPSSPAPLATGTQPAGQSTVSAATQLEETQDHFTDESGHRASTDIYPMKSPPKKMRKIFKKTRKTNSVPIYLCGVCGLQCKDTGDIDDCVDNSIGCDKCFQWFHWGCVGYDGEGDGKWFCEECSQ